MFDGDAAVAVWLPRNFPSDSTAEVEYLLGLQLHGTIVRQHVRCDVKERRRTMFNARRLIVSALGSSCLILVAPMAHADRCPAGYDINRKIQITQGNGFTVNCQLRLSKGEVGPQTRGSFTGICESRGNASQEVHGFIDKNARFKMQVDWNGGSVGVYTGVLNENGRLVDGRTFDASHPANWSDWRIQGSLPCK